jgi:hypothetical protein
LAYRFHFNGQEADNEVAGTGNSYTAEFWQYDSRLGRRWNVDPDFMIDFSVYSTFADNPILFRDPRGNTLILGKDDGQAKKDMLSLLNSASNSKYVIFDDESGEVKLDFKDLKKEEIEQILNEDEGLRLLQDIIQHPKKFLYETTNLPIVANENDELSAMPMFKDGNGVINAGKNGLDSKDRHTHKPRKGFDAQIVISHDAKWTNEITTNDGFEISISKERVKVVFHELAEALERANGINYNGKGKQIGAHDRAAYREKRWRPDVNAGVAKLVTGSISKPNEKEIQKAKELLRQ